LTEPDPLGRHSPASGGDLTPTAKVTAGALTGAFVTVLISVAEHLDIQVPPDVAASLVVLLGGLAAWYKKSRPSELDQ
jgi:hypothetical protein